MMKVLKIASTKYKLIIFLLLAGGEEESSLGELINKNMLFFKNKISR